MNAIPFISLEYQHQSVKPDLVAVFDRVLKRGNFILGEEVQLFETEYGHFQGVKYCIAIGNGLDAITISLKSLGIGKGDEVIVPSHTCFATWLGVTRSGATPVPAEVSLNDYNIDLMSVENVITSRTRAILGVHLYGYPCSIDFIKMMAEKKGIYVIEDNAQAHGAMINGKMTGSWGDINATSFYPTKNLGALGDGGAITSDDLHLADTVRMMRNYGTNQKDMYEAEGYNSRLDELQAGLLRVKLRQLGNWNEMRRQNAMIYFNQLKKVEAIQLPAYHDPKRQSVYHLFVIQTQHRDRLKDYLTRQGIGTGIHYPIPIHLQKAYQYLNYQKGSLPIAELLSQQIISLPVWPGLKPEQIEFICTKITEFYDCHL